MKCIFISATALALCVAALGQDAPTLAETELALRRALDATAARQANGGWGAAYTRDGQIMWGEWRSISKDKITVQPPATPTVASAFVRAAKLLNDPALAAPAKEARDALLKLQTPDGGFPHQGAPDGPRPTRATLDDHVTTSALGFFVELWHYTGAEKDREALHSVGEFLLKAQYDIGGWPQAYPPPTDGYARYITFNDGVTAAAIRACLMLYEETGDARYLDAAKRGGEGIIRLQGGPGEEIWAQQYDPESLEPAWARKFEPPGYSAAESIGVCDVLVDLFLETGDEKYLAPLPKAFQWYDEHRLEDGKWARLYEPGTQRPVYGRRDKAEKVYEFENACEGYAWQSDWYPRAAKAAYAAMEAAGPQAWREKQQANPKREARVEPAAVRSAIDALSEDGTWLESSSATELEEYAKFEVDPQVPIVRMATFARNATLLMDYIKAQQAAPETAQSNEGGAS